MKRMLILLVVLPLIFLAGCMKDEDTGYSLSNYWVSFGVVKQVPSGNGFTIVTDKGNTLDPVAFENHAVYKYGYDDGYALWKNGDRVMVNFTILDEKPGASGKVERYYVRVNSAKKILMKKIADITPSIADSIGNDPLQVLDTWKTDSLLNFKIRYYGKYKTHFINLVKQPGAITAANQPVQLELRHNDNDDLPDYPFVSYVSFRLTGLKTKGLDSVRFVVKAKDYNNNLFEYKGTYR